MTEHAFYMDTAEGEWYPSVHRLGKPVDADEILHRLNATEKLSWEAARRIANKYALNQDDFNTLKTYADMLEGK